MTKLAYTSLQSFTQSEGFEPTEAKQALSIALGVAIARRLPLPQGAVEGLDNQFESLVRSDALKEIAGFNEEIVVDVDLALETARSFWLARYCFAYPNAVDPVMVGEGDFLLRVSGAARFFNEATLTVTQISGPTILSLVNKIAPLLCA